MKEHESERERMRELVFDIGAYLTDSGSISTLYEYLWVTLCTESQFALIYTSLLSNLEIKPWMYEYANEIFSKQEFISWVAHLLSKNPMIQESDIEVYLEGFSAWVIQVLSNAKVMQTLELPEEISEWYTTLFQNTSFHVLMTSEYSIYLIYKSKLYSPVAYWKDKDENPTYFVFSGDTDTYIYSYRDSDAYLVHGKLERFIWKWEWEAMITFTEKDETCFSLNSWNRISRPIVVDMEWVVIPMFQEYFYAQNREFILELWMDSYSWNESDGRRTIEYSKIYGFSKVRDIADDTTIYEWIGHVIDVIPTDDDIYVLVKKPAGSESLLGEGVISAVKNSMEEVVQLYSVMQEDYICHLPEHTRYKTICSPENLLIHVYTPSFWEYIYNSWEWSLIHIKEVSSIRRDGEEYVIYFLSSGWESYILHSSKWIGFDYGGSLETTLFWEQPLH